jgi:hypothetical protein
MRLLAANYLDTTSVELALDFTFNAQGDESHLSAYLADLSSAPFRPSHRLRNGMHGERYMCILQLRLARPNGRRLDGRQLPL